MAAAIGCSMSCASAAPARRAASVTARRSTSVMADGTQITTRGPVEPVDADAVQQQPDHALGDLEVGDRALAQRPDGDDVAGRAADHLPRLVTHRQHLLGALVQRDHGGLVEHDAAAPLVDERVGGAEVDGEVARHGRYRARPDGGRWLRGVGRLAIRSFGAGSSGGGASASISRRKASMPDSIVLGWRCCDVEHQTADRAHHHRDGQEQHRLHQAPPDLGEVLRLEPPALAAVPGLALPDRDGALQLVDGEAGRVERLAAVRSGHRDDHRRVAELHDAGAVQQGHPPDAPATAGAPRRRWRAGAARAGSS